MWVRGSHGSFGRAELNQWVKITMTGTFCTSFRPSQDRKVGTTVALDLWRVPVQRQKEDKSQGVGLGGGIVWCQNAQGLDVAPFLTNWVNLGKCLNLTSASLFSCLENGQEESLSYEGVEGYLQNTNVA